MKWFISHDTLRSDFLRAVEETSREKVSHCYQCGKCSAGCPLAFEMDYLPNQIMRMVQLGMENEVLTSRAIWLCASCETCTTRCPREVDLAEVMDTLRRISYRRHIRSDEAAIPLFNKVFLNNIERFGRLFEMNLIGTFNLLSGDFFKDVSCAPKMFLKGKIKLIPPRVRNIKEVRELVKKSGRMEGVKRERLISFKSLMANLGRKLLGRIFGKGRLS